MEESKMNAAFVAAQAELVNPHKNKTVKTGTFQFDYADLASILDQVRPVLARHGLAISQSIGGEHGVVTVTTTLHHTSGESIQWGPLPGPSGPDWKTLGGAITYARRYALTAALGLSADDDKDAPEIPQVTKATPEMVHAWLAAIAAAPDLDHLNQISAKIAKASLHNSDLQDLVAAGKSRKVELS
jgi:hypothetical protein